MLLRLTTILIILLLGGVLSGCGDKRYPINTSSSSSSASSSASSSSSTSSGIVAAANCDARQFLQPADIRLQSILPDNDIQLPTGVSFLPGNDHVFFVLQQNGLIWRVDLDQTEGDQVERWLDLNDYYNVVYIPEGPGGCHECGLFSMAFHPDFEVNGWVYLSFTEDGDPGNPMHSYVARFQTENDAETVVMGADSRPLRDDIYHYQQPTRIHNSGHIGFGPDGYLYLSLGDGGPGRDPNHNAQNTDLPLGSILRLQDDGSPAPDNGVATGLPEIYAYGLRNPWSWSFDRLTGELWVGDVGQSEIEEVNLVRSGGNYGWPCFEGSQYFDDCASTEDMIPPVFEYSHDEGQSVTGGYVYRGEQMPELFGVYVFGDFGNGLIWGLFPQDNGDFQRLQLFSSGRNISAFAEDAAGELYVVDYANGDVLRVAPAQPDPNLIPLPEKLSQTGCVNANDPTVPAQQLIPYTLNEPFWSDGAVKERFMKVPDGHRIRVEDDGDLDFPIGTVLVKNFRLDDRLIETRLMLRQESTGWSGYSYEWEPDQSEAYLLDAGKDVTIDAQVWRYPNRAECLLCHTHAAGFSLGPEARQLNTRVMTPAGQMMNQLAYFEQLDLFWHPLRDEVYEMKLVASDKPERALERRALSFLHANCSQCHRPGGTTQATLDFRHAGGLAHMNACDYTPINGDLDIPEAKLLAPGDHTRSLLWHRLSRNDDYRMPPIGSNLIDQASVDMIADWIDSIEQCPSKIPADEPRFRIVNNDTGETLFNAGGELRLQEVEEVTAGARWAATMEQNFYRLQSDEYPNDFIHMENYMLNVGGISPEWHSARWSLEAVQGGVRIRSVWLSDQYLYADESGSLRFGPAGKDLPGGIWTLTEID